MYDFQTEWFLGNNLNKPEFICLHVLQSNFYSFTCAQLNSFMYSYLTFLVLSALGYMVSSIPCNTDNSICLHIVKCF